jgi:hypothetical protein
VKYAIFLILCLFTGLLPASGNNIHNSEDLVSIDSAPLPADVLSDPSIPSPFDTTGATSVAALTVDTQRKSAGDSPLAAILGLIAGILTMVGIGGRARRMSPARRVEPDARVTVYHPHAVMPPSAMVHAGGDVLAASQQGGFAWAHDRQARSGSADTGQGRFGQADFRDIAYGGDSVSYGPYGNHDPVVVVYPEARGQWYQGPIETAAPAPIERTPFNIVELDYRIFTLDGGNVRSCQQFSAADDHAALALARLCEPTKAFELWRGSQLVTRQPTIQ